ncbi:MAG: hypothetical protein IJ593_08370, partial [Lachnospiraceae bacterium]|nr:hypothetical protein [Lachnospiraceae bacterium]
ASNGSALYIQGYVKYASISNTTFEGNTTNGSGSALTIENISSASEINLYHDLITGNHAGANGGAIYYSNIAVCDKLTLNIDDTIMRSNTADGNSYGGGAIAFYSSNSIRETEKNEINIRYNNLYADGVSANNEITNNMASNANGGFIYAKDAVIRITNNIPSEKLTFEDNLAKDYGGVFYLEKSYLYLEGTTQNQGIVFDDNALTDGGEGINIYSLGDDNISGVTTHADGISLKNVESIKSEHLFDTGASMIAVGPYADLILDGAIKIGTASSTAKGLYLFNDGVSDLRINSARLTRKLGAGFVYNINDSKIYATTELADDVVVEGYTQHEVLPLTDLFIKDSTYDAEYRVYRSGTRTYRTVHIGNRQGSVRFDIGDGAEIDYKHGSSTIHYTRNELLANVSQGIPFDSGAELDPIMNVGTVPTRTGYTFKGWITTVYASDSRTYAIDNYKFDGVQAYLPSPETELIVRAVWAINGTDVIDVEHYDQLFWKTDADKSRDVTFELHADLDASRSDAVALKSFGRTGKTTIYMAGHTLHVYEDINGFVDENYESEYEILGYGHASDPYLTTDTGSIVYEGLIAKENPLVVAKSLKLQRMDIKDFEMNDVLIDTSKSTDTTGTTLTFDTVEFSNNIRLTIKARSNQIHFDTIGFIDNSAKQSGSSLYAREEYPLVYLTTPSNANDGIIDHATFGDNSYIYSYIMTEQSMASYEQKVIIRNSDFVIGKANVTEKGP